MRIVKDMALTPEIFLRDLPRAMAGLDYAVEGHRVAAAGEGRSLTIELKPLPPRVLGGLLSLERSEVTLSFEGWSEAEQAAFLERFDRAYQRGGG